MKPRRRMIDDTFRLLLISLVSTLMTEPIFGQQACMRWIKKPSVGSPGRRSGHAMAYDSDRGVTVLFGGENRDVEKDETYYLKDTWEYDGASWKRIEIRGTIPDTRSGHAMAYDSERKQIVLYGGVNEDYYLADTWTYTSDGTRGTWTQHFVAGTGSIAGHAMVYDSARKRTILHGGTFPSDPFGNVVRYISGATFEWDGLSWSDAIIQPGTDTKRTRHAMIFDPDRSESLFFGGLGCPCGTEEDGALGTGTWVNDGLVWVPKIYGDPALRQEHAMAYDIRRKKVVMFGGKNGDGDNTPEDSSVIGDDTDEYTDGIGWTSLFSSGPPARARHAMVYDSKRDVIVMFGGRLVADGLDFGSIYNDTWELVDICVHPVPPEEFWVDFAYRGDQNGTLEAPFFTLAEAVNHISTPGLIRIRSGSTSETLTIQKAVRLQAFGGPVTIGKR
jgi:hypothetical protein